MKTFDDVLDLMARDHYDMTMFIVKWKELLSETPQDVEFRFFDNTVHYVPNFAKLRSNEMFDMFLRKSGGELYNGARLKFPASAYTSGGLTYDRNSVVCDSSFVVGEYSTNGMVKTYSCASPKSVEVYSSYANSSSADGIRITPSEIVFRKKSLITCGKSNILVEYDLGLSLTMNNLKEVYLNATRTWIQNPGEATGVSKLLVSLPMNSVCGIYAGLCGK